MAGATGTTGPTGATGPAAPGTFAPYWPVFPSVVPTITTIYANQSGNDITGNGSAGNPYLTAQRAFRDIPPLIDPGNQVNVDVTNLGVEVFPPGYQFPQIQASSLMYTWYDNLFTPFAWSGALNIIATPQPVASVPIADTLLPAGSYTVTTDPDTFLGTIVLTGPMRASWGSNALKGKFLIPTGGQPNAQAYATAVISASDTTSISLTNYGDEIAGDFQIMEPSATFQCSELSSPSTFTGQTFWQGGSFQAIGQTTIAFQGIKFINTDPNIWASALAISGSTSTIVELCDVDGGLTIINNQLNAAIYNSVVRSAGKVFVAESAEILANGVLITDVEQWYIVTGSNSFVVSVFDNCPSFSTSPNNSLDGGLGNIGTELVSCLITNSTGPEAGVWAKGVGGWSLEDTKIENTVTGDGLLVEGPGAPVLLHHVNGTGNAGVGVHVNDGGTVRLITANTNITGTGVGNDMKVGTLPPRSWGTAPATPPGNFYFDAPIKNEYDLTTPFAVNAGSGLSTPAGEEVTGAGTGGRSGSRLFQRPGS